MQDRPLTLEELTRIVFALRQELTHAVTESLVEQAHQAVVSQCMAVCPQCGQVSSARDSQSVPWGQWWGRSGSDARTFTVSIVSVGVLPWLQRWSWRNIARHLMCRKQPAN